MKKPTYLNSILTAIALLLSALVWLNIADRNVLSTGAVAQTISPPPTGVPNAGAQREAIKRAVENVERKVDRLYDLLAAGKMKVEVTNLKDIPREEKKGD